jgi:uncharacterized membrane protein YidH (DUF202 family)
MPETPPRERRRLADIVVIGTGLLLVAMAAWNAPASASARNEVASFQWLYAAYGLGGVLALAALFVAHRSRTLGRILLVAAALVVLGFGLNTFRQASTTVWLTVVLPALLLLGATPFFGAMPRAHPR